jgi:very-short-patch-repair endonuclease
MHLLDQEKFNCFQRFRSRLLKNKTKAELRFESLLIELGLKFKVQKGLLDKSKTFAILDYYLPKPYRLAIELDGKYHDTPEQTIKANTSARLRKDRPILVSK